MCVVREGHPTVGKRLSLEQYVALEHVQVAPRGKPGGYIDDALAERGLVRRVARAVPFFLAALRLTAETDYVLTILGGPVDRILRQEAPGACLRFIPNTADDPAPLRDQGSDLAVGIYGDLPPEMRNRQLLTDRFVCVVRRGHPVLRHRFTLEEYVAIPHIQVAPRGQPGGYLDDVLRERGLHRTVARAVPYFVTALQLAAETDYLLTTSERIARRFAAPLSLEVLEVPIKLRPYALSLLWHPRVDADPAHRFLREVFLRASKEAAGDRHDEPRTRLGSSEPGRRRGRRRS